MSASSRPSSSRLATLEDTIQRDLERIEAAPRAWLPRRSGPDGATLHNVVIVGAGLSGLSIGFGLKRQGVGDVVLIDRSDEGREGPWISCARMDTLRSPKHLSGPDLGVPSLTYRSWYEAAHGEAAWESVGKIDRTDWMDYLVWYRRMAALDVRNRTTLKAIRPLEDYLVLDIETSDGPGRLYARKLVLATGIEGAGGLAVPPFVADLPRESWTHSGEAVAAVGMSVPSIRFARTQARELAERITACARDASITLGYRASAGPAATNTTKRRRLE